MKVIRIGFMVIILMWMAFTAYILVRIAEDLSYLRGSSDYTIELLDQISGNVEPILQLQHLDRNRSFSCSINTPRILDI
jgi:hypothetical protein